MDHPDDTAALTTWTALNAFLMACEDEVQLQTLLDREQLGKRRQEFVKRIHSRINKVRADRERRELLK